MTTETVAGSIVLGSALEMMRVLFPEPLKSQGSVELAANTRFATEWQACKEGWGEDEDSLMAAAEEMMGKGLLRPFNGGMFSITDQFEIDQVRQKLGLQQDVAADFLEIITSCYQHVMLNAGKEAGELCLKIQVENQVASDEVESLLNEQPVAPISDIVNIDSEGPDDTTETDDDLHIDNTALEGSAETAPFSETQTSEVEPILNTADWDEQISLLEVQDKTELAGDTETTTEPAVFTADETVGEFPGSGSHLVNEDPRTDEITSNTTPALVDGPVNIAEAIAAYDAKITDLFLSPITAREQGELKLELQDCETHDFDARIRELGGVPSEALQYAQMDRMERLVNLIAEFNIETLADTTTEDEIDNPAVEDTIVETPPAETLELKKPYEVAGFKTHESWLASFVKDKPKTEAKVIQMEATAKVANPETFELNAGGKYTGGKGGNAPIKSVQMTEKQAAMAAKKVYKSGGKQSTNLKGMGAVLNSAFGLQTYELAKLNTCSVGEEIAIFPSNLLPNQYQKASKPANARIQVKIGTAYFSKEGKAYGFGLHWRNLPTTNKGEVPDFVWPVVACKLKFEQKSQGQWFKNEIMLPIPLIVSGQFGHAEQNKSGKMPTAFLKSDNPVCFKPVITAASTNHLTNMTNLGYVYLGTVEIPKGREYMRYGITGMKIHVFLNPNTKGLALSEWKELGLLENI